MKPIVQTLLVLMTLWIPVALSAQTPAPGKVELTLTLLNNQGQPMKGEEVEFVETKTREKVSLATDEEGKLVHLFNSGRYWQINVGKVRDYFYWQFEVPPGKSYTMSRTITYHHDRFLRETRPPVDRSQLNLQTVSLNTRIEARPDEQKGVVQLKINRPNKAPLGNYPVELTCYALRKTFVGKTNTAGQAWFKVPRGQEYEIDIDGIESFKYVDLPDVPRYRTRTRMVYEPTIIKEKMVRDTIVQELPDGQKGTSGRVLATVILRGGSNGTWRNEPVFLEVMGEKKWYRSRTNVNGEVRFLIPKGKQYMIHGRFEPDLDVLDFRRRRGIGYSHKSVLYRPKAKYQFPEQYIPKPEELIVTEFQRFLERSYARPKGADMVRTLAEFTGVLNPNSKEAVLRLAVTTAERGDIAHAPPLNLSFVIDKSGSMAGHERIGNLKTSLEAFLGQLRPEDRVSLVTFEDFEEVPIPSQKLDLEHCIRVIQTLEAGGGTNIYKGLMAGYKEVARHFSRNAVNRVILLSDGYGVTPPKEIVEAQKPYTAKGIDCSTVGVGEDYNFALLQLLASQGGGHLQHVGDAADLQSAFMDELSRVLFPVARNVEMEITYPEGLEYKQLYGYEVQEKKGRRLKLKLKQLAAGTDQLAFLRFRVQNPTPEMYERPVVIKLRYRDLKRNELVEQVVEAKLEWTDQVGQAELVMEENERKMYAVAVMNQSMKVMGDRFHRGDIGGARDAVQDGMDQLKELFPATTDEDLSTLKVALEDYLDVLEQQLKAG